MRDAVIYFVTVVIGNRAVMNSETWVFSFGRRRLTADTTVLVWRWELQEFGGTGKRSSHEFENLAACIQDARGSGYTPGSRLLVEHTT
jgi:hypothetical protein